MLLKKRTLATTAVTAGLLLLGGVGVAQAAEAPGIVDTSASVTLAPGETGRVPASVTNTGYQINFDQGGTAKVVFTAPANTTFPVQTTVPSALSYADGRPGATGNLQNCVLSNAGKTLTCDQSTALFTNVTFYGANGDSSGLNKVALTRTFSPLVTVDVSAPWDTELGQGTSTYPLNNATVATNNNGGTQNIGNATATSSLKVRTPAEIPAPLVNPAMAGGLLAAGALTAGTVYFTRRNKTA